MRKVRNIKGEVISASDKSSHESGRYSCAIDCSSDTVPRPAENRSVFCSRLNCSFTLAEWAGLMIGYTGLRREIWSFTALMEILIKS